MEPQVNWSQVETEALIAVWSEEKIQRDLWESFQNEKVYREMSRRLAAVGLSRTAKQCRDKIKKLKLEYRRVKRDGCGSSGDRGKSFRWYDAMDPVMSERPAATRHAERAAAIIHEFVTSDVEIDSPTMSDIPGGCTITPYTAPTPCPAGFYSIQLEDDDGPSTSAAAQTSVTDGLACRWSKSEVQALLTLWANPAVQEELLLNVRNNRVYSRLSAKLASLGFNKSAKKCREKIKKLKQDYKRIKNGRHRGEGYSTRTSAWFAIMDDVLTSEPAAARRSRAAEPSLLTQSRSVPSVDADDETQWLSDEVQVLMTLWAQPNIQRQLLTTATNSQVFEYLSSELASVGFNKTPHQCSVKVNNLKQEYRKVGPHADVKSNCFAILDSVLGPDGETSTEVYSAVLTRPESPEDEGVNDTSQAVWTPDEVEVLLTRWAEESIQEQLRSAPGNEGAFAELSSELATYGFDKTTSQCRSKIQLLKQKYRNVQEQGDSKMQNSGWFVIMDKVLGRRMPEAATEQAADVMDSAPASLQTPQQETVEDIGCRLSVSSLCLLVPTLRLMCAFAWQVVQCCDVLRYGKVEELVRLVSELAPDLLTHREKVQLLLRLRARMVLELCRSESTANLLNVEPHLKVIQNLTVGSTCDQELSLQELEELENSKSNFMEIIHILLEDTEERKMFFKEVFPIHYGQQYEATLRTLVWKFISRLDSLLPIPDIKQTAEWLSTAPSVMEDCEQLVLEPDQLRSLLHFHQEQSGSTNKCHSQTQNMFLPKLCLPPKPNSKQLASEQQEMSTDGEDEGQFYYSVDEPSRLQSKEPETDNVFHTLDAETCTPEMRSAANTCDYCARVFKSASALSSHIKTHTALFHCDKCGKKYSSRASLNVHRRIHTGETPYLCSHCGRGFRTSHCLSLHVRIHTGDRPYKCHICGKTSIQHLARHMRMHRGEKNYLCTECGKAFLSNGELRLHTRIHTGERPYTCKHCGKGFTAKCHMTVHMRHHTGDSPYRCSVCPKSFRTLRAQKKHLMIHSNNKSFQCLKCGKIFRQEDTFKTHIQTHI